MRRLEISKALPIDVLPFSSICPNRTASWTVANTQAPPQSNFVGLSRSSSSVAFLSEGRLEIDARGARVAIPTNGTWHLAFRSASTGCSRDTVTIAVR